MITPKDLELMAKFYNWKFRALINFKKAMELQEDNHNCLYYLFQWQRCIDEMNEIWHQIRGKNIVLMLIAAGHTDIKL